MTKNELVNFLERSRMIEEAVLLYSEHIKNTLYLSGLEKEFQAQLQDTLNTLSKESNEHKILMDQLIVQVKKGDQDVY